MSIEHILNTVTIPRNKQVELYMRMDASPGILRLTHLSGRVLGVVVEKLTKKILELDERTHPTHDARINNIIIEIKCSRMWGGKVDCYRWQHVMIAHPYQWLVLVGVDFSRLRFWVITKQKILELYNRNIVKQQGKGEGQGLWFTYKSIRPFLTEVFCKQDLLNYADVVE
jgi:hypothetical protein